MTSRSRARRCGGASGEPWSAAPTERRRQLGSLRPRHPNPARVVGRAARRESGRRERALPLLGPRLRHRGHPLSEGATLRARRARAGRAAPARRRRGLGRLASPRTRGPSKPLPLLDRWLLSHRRDATRLSRRARRARGHHRPASVVRSQNGATRRQDSAARRRLALGAPGTRRWRPARLRLARPLEQRAAAPTTAPLAGLCGL